MKIAHEDGIWCLSWSKKGNRIVTGSVDGKRNGRDPLKEERRDTL